MLAKQIHPILIFYPQTHLIKEIYISVFSSSRFYNIGQNLEMLIKIELYLISYLQPTKFTSNIIASKCISIHETLTKIWGNNTNIQILPRDAVIETSVFQW